MEVARPDPPPAHAARGGGLRRRTTRRGRARHERGARTDARARPHRAVSVRAARNGVQGLVATQLTMPKLSDSMAEAVIIKWLKSPGEAFARGEALIEVETDKATVIYEAETDGTLGAILVPEGGTAAIGQPIATLGNGAAPVPSATAATERQNATPVARRTAVELGISLHGI